MKFLKFIVLSLLINFSFLLCNAQASSLINQVPYYSNGAVFSSSDYSQVIYNSFSLKDSSVIDKFNWYGQNIDNNQWQLSFYEATKINNSQLYPGNLIYNKIFSSNELSNKYKAPSYTYDYFYSYNLATPMLLKGNTDYFVSIKSLSTMEHWGWSLSEHYGAVSVAKYPNRSDVFDDVKYSFQLEGNSAPIPEPSTAFIGLFSLIGAYRLRRKA